MSELSRRAFLAAAGAGALALPGCGKREDLYALAKPPVPGAERWSRGEEKWVASSCGMCPAGCGIQVRVKEGRAVNIEGNPEHPINRGSLGPKGSSGVQMLYHPDRIPGPLRRYGARGEGGWKPVKWAEALDEIARTLRELRASGKSRGLAVVDGEPRGMVHELWARFLTAYGSPNHFDHRSVNDGGKVLAMAYMHGVPEVPAYDWTNTRFILGFGASLFESWCQSIHFTRASSHLRRGLPGQRVKFVQVSPRFSVTATKADEWVPIEPATYGALALGLGHVLVREKLCDEAFLREHTFGFEDWKDAQGRAHRGFRDLLLKDYAPEKVSRLTGAPVETIERLAHEMAAHRPALALADGGAAAATNGLGTAMAIHALNALLGNLERPGGLLVQRPAPLAPWPEVAPDEAARTQRAAPRLDGAGGAARPLGYGSVQDLPQAILSRQPYPVEALILYKSNPVFSKPEGQRWIEALKQIPLVISCSPLRDESTFWADFVLPDSTYLERWEAVATVPSVGYPNVGLRQPVVPAVHDTLATGDVVIRLAQALGAPLSEAFPWKDYREACQERLKGLLDAPGGTPAAAELPELTKALQRDGSWSAPGNSFEKWESAFRTPSGKFEFYSQQIEKRLAELFPGTDALEKRLAAAGISTRGDELCLPHWEPPVFSGSPQEFPFVLIAYRGIGYAEGGSRHLPWLQELPLNGFQAWNERIELNPVDAQALGLRDGAGVWVESTAGQRQLTVHLHAGIRVGTAALRLGGGAWPPSPSDAAVSGGYGLLANASDPLAGIFALQCTRVKIRKG